MISPGRERTQRQSIAMPENGTQTFFEMIRRAQRGRLKVYLGYGPGVGKTYRMLEEARQLKDAGIDIVLGLVETHDRPETLRLLEGLEIIPHRKVPHGATFIEEMDVEAVLRRRPQVAVVDEMAHTNVPGVPNVKRYQDIEDILTAGIHVISTLNIQHVESFHHTVEAIIGIKIKECVPDAVLTEADQVVNIDITAEELLQRLRQGKIYPKEVVESSLGHFFTESHLEHLRDLTRRQVAMQFGPKGREAGEGGDVGGGRACVMACVSSRGPACGRLLRYAAQLAGSFNRNWYAVYVRTPAEGPLVIDSETSRKLSDTLTLAQELGGKVISLEERDVADAILQFAHEKQIEHVVIGRPRPTSWSQLLKGDTSIAEELIYRSKGLTVIVVDTENGD
jgi:two-component system, OmpR family, sensor histidine kinase KdpD